VQHQHKKTEQADPVRVVGVDVFELREGIRARDALPPPPGFAQRVRRRARNAIALSRSVLALIARVMRTSAERLLHVSRQSQHRMATFVRSALEMSAGLRRIDFRRRHAASPTAPSPETTQEAVDSPHDDPDLRRALLRLAARESAFGARHPDVASELHLIGALHHEAGRYDDALAYYSLALAIRERALSSDHPEVASTLEDLAATREAQGEAAEAEELLARAQRLRLQYRQLKARPAS